MGDLLLTATYATSAEFLTAYDNEIAKAGLLVRGAMAVNTQAMSACRVSVRVAGSPAVEIQARVAAVVPSVGVAVMLDGVPPALADLAQRLRPGAGAHSAPEAASHAAGEPDAEEAEAPQGPLFDRLKAMTVTQKMQLALSGTREERMAIFRDLNKSLHVFVLRNPRISIDEVQYAAKLASLSPDAIRLISEHREWGSNATVITALVRNPKTPMPLALRLLEKVPLSELRALAKGGAREQLVHAARRKVNG